jgi:type II secretory pathway component PulJ
MIWARQESGFTLVELLVTMTLTFIIFGATLAVLDVFQSNNRFAQLRNETQDNARNAVDRLARELRNVAAPGTESPGAVEQASAYSLTFQTIDSRQVTAENPTNTMRVRYCLNDSSPSNEVLWRQVMRWGKTEVKLPTATSCPDLTAGDWERSEQLVSHVTNEIGGQSRHLFEYGPLSWTVISQIISVGPNLFIDLNPGGRPGESQLTSVVSLRNENRPPIAAFTAVQGTLAHSVLLNASESSDPDGLALTYKWWDGSTSLNSTAQQYEVRKLEPGSNHTFKLEVTNPGGLHSALEKTVKVE